MLSGLTKKILKNSIPCLIAAVALSGCKEKANFNFFSYPDAGTQVHAGTKFTMHLQLADHVTPDSIVYLLDSAKIAAKKDTAGVEINTEGLTMGSHLITAKVYGNGTPEDVTTNFVVVAANAPVEYRYKIVNTFPHDTASFTEGLEYHDGFLYESTGEYGKSKLLRVNLATGKPAQQFKMDDKYFGEGMTMIGDKIVQLTYRENVGFVYDKTSFKKQSEFSYPASREGWGLAFDGKKILNTSGGSDIYYLDPNTYQTIGSLSVYDHNGPVNDINELEYIDGKIYANIYNLAGPYANHILIIDPKTGAVEATINLVGLNPMGELARDIDHILNGIAWDSTGKRLFVTGKKWSKLFEIEVVKN